MNAHDQNDSFQSSQDFQSKLTESHHRTKNTLQNIISYSNIMIKGKSSISKEELDRLVRYIHSLSLINDIILEETLKSGTANTIRIDKVMARISDQSLDHITCNSIPPIFGTPRLAASLCLVLNELIGYAKCLSYKQIHLNVEKISDSQAVCVFRIQTIDNYSTNQQLPDKPCSVVLAESIAKADFESALDWQLKDDTILITFQFPLSKCE